MVTSELMGGLGNQMFQMSAAISLAIDNNDDFCFDIYKHRIGLQGRNAVSYEDNVFKKINSGNVGLCSLYKEPIFNYSRIPYVKNIKLIGYFQSEKYFSHNKETILDIFSPEKDKIVYYKSIIDSFSGGLKTVSLHVRRGDYIYFSNIHPVIDEQYIKSSLCNFNNHTIIVFSDDMSWCFQNIKNNENNIVFISEKFLDYEEMYLMSSCDHNIISNSTFSWWGSYLNRNANKKIVAPKKWFGSGFNQDFSDIYTNNMIII